MKAHANMKTKEISIDTEAKKAIRFVLGYNTFHTLLDNPNAKDTIWRFLDEHRFEIFGSDFGLSKPDAESDEWNLYENLLTSATYQIMD